MAAPGDIDSGGPTQITNFRIRYNGTGDWYEMRQVGVSSHLVNRKTVFGDPHGTCPEYFAMASACSWNVPIQFFDADGPLAISPGTFSVGLTYNGDFVGPPFETVWEGTHPFGFGLFFPSDDPSYPSTPPIMGDCAGAHWDYFYRDAMNNRIAIEGEFNCVGSKTYPAGVSCGADKLLKFNGRNAIPTDFPSGFFPS